MSRVPGRVALGLAAVLAGLVAGVGATSGQQVTILEAPGEQRIEALDTQDRIQDVRAIDGDSLQSVGEPEPRGRAGQIASTAAKIGMTAVALAVSVGVTVAALLFI